MDNIPAEVLLFFQKLPFSKQQELIQKLTQESAKNNPTTLLAAMCQKKFKQNPLFGKPSVIGPKDGPTIAIELTLPGGKKFNGTGDNQILAKADASEQALKYLQQ